MIAIIGSDGFIGEQLVIWAKKLHIPYIGIYFKDSTKGDIQFYKFVESLSLKKIQKFIIVAGNSNHSLPRLNFNAALEKDVSYLIKLCQANRNTDIVFLSSAAVYYGYSGVVYEEMNIEPMDFYGLSKFYAELMIKLVSKRLNGRLIIYRLTNAFGKSRRNRFFDKIIECLKTGKSMKVYGNGESYINPLPVDKVAEILIKTAVKIEDLCKNGENKIFNLSSNETVKVIDIISYLSRKYGLLWEFYGHEEQPVKFIVRNTKLKFLLNELGIELKPIEKNIDDFIKNNFK